MATIGDARALLVNAAQMLLYSSDTASIDPETDPTTLLANIQSINFPSDCERQRSDAGGKRSYGHKPPDIQLEFLLTVSIDAVAALEERGTYNYETGMLPEYVYGVQLTPRIKDTTNKALFIKFTGQLEYVELERSIDEVGNPAKYTCRVICTDDNFVIKELT